MRRFEQLGIAVDQFINACCGGWADETLSCRAWRKRNDGHGWRFLRCLIDCIFFWQEDHCKQAYRSELERKQLPEELRGDHDKI